MTHNVLLCSIVPQLNRYRWASFSHIQRVSWFLVQLCHLIQRYKMPKIHVWYRDFGWIALIIILKIIIGPDTFYFEWCLSFRHSNVLFWYFWLVSHRMYYSIISEFIVLNMTKYREPRRRRWASDTSVTVPDLEWFSDMWVHVGYCCLGCFPMLQVNFLSDTAFTLSKPIMAFNFAVRSRVPRLI